MKYTILYKGIIFITLIYLLFLLSMATYSLYIISGNSSNDRYKTTIRDVILDSKTGTIYDYNGTKISVIKNK